MSNLWLPVSQRPAAAMPYRDLPSPHRFPAFRLSRAAARLCLAGLLACAVATPAAAAPARTAEDQAVLDKVGAGDLAAPSVEALLRLAAAGDADAAVQAGKLYERGSGVLWDPPSALRWYAAAALTGDAAGSAQTTRLWGRLTDLNRKRAEALLVKYFTDEEIARLG